MHGRVPLSDSTVTEIERVLALSSAYNDERGHAAVRHQIQVVAFALQLVKPAFSFLHLWTCQDENALTEVVDRAVSDLGMDLGHNPISAISDTTARQNLT
jgi:hypothetical protein